MTLLLSLKTSPFFLHIDQNKIKSLLISEHAIEIPMPYRNIYLPRGVPQRTKVSGELIL